MSYTIRPEAHELREARETIQGVLEACKYILEKDEMIEVNIGSAPSDNQIDFGASGYTVNSEQAQIFIRPEKDGWKKDLEKLVYQIYGESYYYEKTEFSGFLWQNLVAEALGLMFLEQNTEGREPEKDQEEFKDEWKNLKDSLADQVSEIDPESIQWQIKWYIGEKLTDEHSFEEFDSLKKSDVKEVGEEIFE